MRLLTSLKNLGTKCVQGVIKAVECTCEVCHHDIFGISLHGGRKNVMKLERQLRNGRQVNLLQIQFQKMLRIGINHPSKRQKNGSSRNFLRV